MAVLVMEEEEEDMVEEDLAMATRVVAMEVVMTTMEEVTYWCEITERSSCKSVPVICPLRGGGCKCCLRKLLFYKQYEIVWKSSLLHKLLEYLCYCCTSNTNSNNEIILGVQ